MLWHESKKSVDAECVQLAETVDILDIEVEDTHKYYSNGILSHNTMHGDPYVTPGGKGIPFGASVRIRLGSGNPIKDDKTGVVIGTHVTVTTKKNKCAPAHRKCEFDIFFGRGIIEHEYIFDEVRASCADKGPMNIGDETALIDGTGAWKSLIVKNSKTGDVKLEKKFYKSEFNEIMKHSDYKKYCDALIDRAYVLDFSKSIPAFDEDEVTTDE